MTWTRAILRLGFFFLVASSFSLAADIEVPKYRGYVNDFADVLSPQDEQALESFLGNLEQATTAEVAVVTVRSVKPYAIDQYGIALGDQWKVGKKGKDNGVIIIVAVDDREWRIEVGYGLEHVIPDARAWQIGNTYMVPSFKRNDYAGGIKAATQAIGTMIAADQGVALKERIATAPVKPKPQFKPDTFIPCCFAIVILLTILLRLGIWPFLILGGLGRGSFWSGGGFSGGSGGFSGGFSGFGGGGFGGGGASGRW